MQREWDYKDVKAMNEYSSLSQQLLIGEALKCAAHNVPKQEAFVFEEKRLTYEETLKKASSAAGWILSQGIRKGDHIACLFKNNLEFIDVYFGASLSGTVLVPVNFRLVPNELIFIINQSEARMLFIEAEYVEMIHSISEQLPMVEHYIVNGTASLPKGWISYNQIGMAAELPVDLRDDDAHVIIYTSGTTGKPKGAVLSHKNLYMNAQNKMYHSPSPLGTKLLIVPPLFHVAGLAHIAITCLMQGTMHIQREYQPVQILETIEREGINSMFLVPSMWNFLLQVPNFNDYDVSSMKVCAIGGAICPLEIKKGIMNAFPNAQLNEAFGQTEMSPTTTYLTGEDTLRKTDSVGRPSINVRIRIVDEEMNDVPIGEVGEIVYQGPTMMKEYYRNLEGTKEAFRGGWFHSGDLVRMDEEGFIYIVDRKKDMIISGAENIYPKEIEEALYQHEAVLESAVIGVPDADWGESVKAFIVLKPGYELSEQNVIDHCRLCVSSYKKPRYVEFIETLPKNASGKILKTALRQGDYAKE
ncbi:class I adenylate-forming enzyme family protein [Gracilibacillus sp. Marseille-QA3620]